MLYTFISYFLIPLIIVMLLAFAANKIATVFYDIWVTIALNFIKSFKETSKDEKEEE